MRSKIRSEHTCSLLAIKALLIRILPTMFVTLIAFPDLAVAQNAYLTNKHPEQIVSTNPKVHKLVDEALKAEYANDLETAIDLNKKILDIEPTNVRSITIIAGLYGTLGKFNDEILWANKAISINPNFTFAYINYGNGLAGVGKIEAAAKAYAKAQTLDPKSPLPPYSLGWLKEIQHDFVKAAQLYEQSIKLDPKFEEGRYSLAAAYANLGQFDKAKNELNILLKQNPSAKDAQDMLEKIKLEKKP